MFGLASGFYQNYMIPPEVSILIVGLDDAGKTTLLERVKVTDFSGPKASTGKRIGVQKRRSMIPTVEMIPEEKNEKVSPVRKLEKKSSSRRRMFACPAPGSYKRLNYDSDEVTDYGDNDGIIELPAGHYMSPEVSPSRSELHVNLITNGNSAKNDDDDDDGGDNDDKQYDVKAGKTMFPLHLIRPTREFYTLFPPYDSLPFFLFTHTHT